MIKYILHRMRGEAKIEDRKIGYRTAHEVFCAITPREVRGWLEADGDRKDLNGMPFTEVRTLLGKTFPLSPSLRFCDVRQIVYENQKGDMFYEFNIESGAILSGSGKYEKRTRPFERAYLELLVPNCRLSVLTM